MCGICTVEAQLEKGDVVVRTLQSLFVVIGLLLASVFAIAGQAQQVGVASRRNSIGPSTSGVADTGPISTERK